ncbi:metallophosphoesterase [Fructilactobacillus vespulae]|uniref:bifunctional metallophosphatase/5'-nucleotidase n=1 Tax=Fructilactobacillus vespulae TaxID=1249630 RepID=UPI0039B45C0E
MNNKIAILHTNDLHSHFENFPRIQRFMQNETTKLEKEGYHVLRVDDGDAIDRFNPLTDVTSGRENVKLLNQLHYFATTIGNNEVLTTSHDELNQLYDQANFDVLIDNVIDEKTGEYPKWAKLYKDLKLKDGKIIRFMALTFPYATFNDLGWDAKPVYETIQKLIEKWKGQYDCLILLSHLGINFDREIAVKFPEISIIIGGHTHHLLENGLLIDNTLLTAAEKWGHYIGEITFNLDDGVVKNRKAKTIKVDKLAVDNQDEKWVSNLDHLGRSKLAKRKVADLPQKLSTSLTDDNDLIEVGLNAMNQYAGTQAAVLNTGLFLDDLSAGIVDMNQIQKVLPHNIHVMKTELYGYDLWRLVKEMEKNKKFLIRFEQKGMGFRGKYFGKLIYKGLYFDEKKQQLFFQDELVLPYQKYEIALLDHYNFIPFFPTINIVGKNHIYFEGTLKEMFAEYLTKKYPIKGGSNET